MVGVSSPLWSSGKCLADTLSLGMVLSATAAAAPAAPAPEIFKKSLRLSSTSATPPFCLPWEVEYLRNRKGQADFRLLAPRHLFVCSGPWRFSLDHPLRHITTTTATLCRRKPFRCAEYKNPIKIVPHVELGLQIHLSMTSGEVADANAKDLDRVSL